MLEKWYYRVLLRVVKNPLTNCFWRTPVEGIQSTSQCALEDHDMLVDGGYYAECKITTESKLATDKENSARLWE